MPPETALIPIGFSMYLAIAYLYKGVRMRIEVRKSRPQNGRIRLRRGDPRVGTSMLVSQLLLALVIGVSKVQDQWTNESVGFVVCDVSHHTPIPEFVVRADGVILQRKHMAQCRPYSNANRFQPSSGSVLEPVAQRWVTDPVGMSVTMKDQCRRVSITRNTQGNWIAMIDQPRDRCSVLHDRSTEAPSAHSWSTHCQKMR